MSERQTVAGAYAKIDAHEDVCAVRYANIHEAIGDLKKLVQGIIGGIIAAVLAVIAWMAVQLYTFNNQRLQALEQPSQTVVVQQPKAR